MKMAITRRAMPDPPMSAIEVRLERVNRAVALDRAVTEMVRRYTDTSMRMASALPRQGEMERLRRSASRQYQAFQRLLYALMRLAQSTDADLQRSVTRR